MRLKVSLLCAFALARIVSAETMRVQVQSGQVRGTPSFLGQVITTLPYGQAVEITGAQGAWTQVRTPDGKTGWMNSSALTTKKISTRTGGNVSAGASGNELALAGKGFNADVEAQFKAQHAEVDFACVDRMVKMNASPSEIDAFAKAGGLKQTGGEQ